MPYIRMLRGTVCGGQVVSVGEIVEASDKDARYLIRIGKAEACEKPKPRRNRARRAPVNRQVDTAEIETR